ncbi:MAG: tripartite tricarboxylate transporter substrate binding protein [Rhizobiales bacterium]|nr:tripartite tricarboxylate transporter substrate binding protein [Hyphomicrobiales bacterium]
MLRGTAAAAFGLALLVTPAAAQGDYPSRTVRIIVPATPGGGSDTFARLIAQHLAKELNQQFVVENRPGGGTLPAMEYVASQPADGYTLYLSPSTTTSMHLVRKSMPWDVRKTFTGVTQIAVLPQSLVINPKVPATSVKEFIALAKREPGKLSYGSAGPGTGPHMAMELFNLMAGIKIQHIPYRGVSQSVNDIVGGSISGMMLNVLTAKPQVEAGHLRMLGLTSMKRSSAMPDVPTIAEAGVPDYEALQWFGLMARSGTPPAILNRLQKLIAEGMRSPQMQARLKTEGADAVVNTPEVFQKLINDDIERWTKLAKAINLKPE